ncbi:MAG TPA: flagellar M-ring protein FliF [Anaerolinea thermolimosa]|uniref:Flagellar M-ring protein n=1 Tax=Anaerolinea thermolimosa TaxID=229919 RepID=A0A3D1JHL4_9CHLR|nr:flagellar basal-body MS-ring/collar protein FliF [Anaerolinea thermolimosa]GAP07873.1 flagellar basal-body M-ring protein [Anaerolinea thermolimosa]HCE18002.1 flagellar M-ring protein FliF [Anaerolinea thermolimosa]
MFASLQTQFLNYWKKTSKSQRIVTITLLLAAAILIPTLIQWANTPTYSVAFSGLSEADAGQIVQKLEENGIDYRLRDSGTILVRSDKVYDVRLRMAREGLPKSSTVGYELFSQNTLGMTEFTQRVNYQRALEGELERTIGSIESIESVRVHVVTPEKSLLVSDQAPTTASVTLKVKPGRNIEMAQVRAITHLVASSVEGLQPENVVVVDTEGNMLSSGGNDDLANAAAQSDSQRAAEAQAAAEVRRRVQSMLDKILGPNRSTVQAAVAMDWSHREVTSNTFDPTPVAVRSSQKINESYNTDSAVSGGVPGAASNLPTPVPQLTGTPQPGVIYSRSEETINYEISQVQSKEIITPGRISRVSVSVMVDNVTDAGQLATIKAAVAAAAGIDEARGDQVVVESMAFDHTYAEQQNAEYSKAAQTEWYFRIGSIALGVIVLIGLLWYFSRLMRNLRLASRAAWQPILRPVSEVAALAQPGTAAIGAGAASPMAQIEAGLSQSQGMGGLPAGQPRQVTQAEQDVLVEISKPRARHTTNPEDEERAKVISKLAEENPATVAEIIQIWLSEDEKRNG